jgi:hypothetical protein
MTKWYVKEKRYGGTESNRLMEKDIIVEEDSTGYEIKVLLWSLLIAIISLAIMVIIYNFTAFTLFYCILFNIAMFVSGVSFLLASMAGTDYLNHKM